MNKYRLSKIYLISCFIFYSSSLLGPYRWKIYSYTGIVVFCLFCILFYLGLVLGRRLKTKKNTILVDENHYSHIVKEKKTLIFFSILSIIYGLILLSSIVGNISGYAFLSASYYGAMASRSQLEKFLTLFLNAGVASYLLSINHWRDLSKINKIVLIMGLWTPAIVYLSLGSRFLMVTTFILMVLQNKKSAKRIITRVKSKKLLLYFLFILGGILIFYISYILMRNRELYYTSLTRFEFQSGDQELKPWAYDIFVKTNGTIDPFFRFFDYSGEAPYVFSAFWKMYYPEHIYYGACTFRLLFLILRSFGIPLYSYSDVLMEVIDGIGKYSGFGFTLIIDFGLIGAFVFTFIFACILSYIEKTRYKSSTRYALYCCSVVVVVFAPIYDFYIGKMDYTLFWILIISFVCKKFRFRIRG